MNPKAETRFQRSVPIALKTVVCSGIHQSIDNSKFNIIFKQDKNRNNSEILPASTLHIVILTFSTHLHAKNGSNHSLRSYEQEM